MQDKYAGDVGDFGKFILLNELVKAGDGKIRLGINWYRTTGMGESSNDGRHIAYLKPTTWLAKRFEMCDPHLYAALREVVRGTRTVRTLEQSRVLPPDTLFYADPLPDASTEPERRAAARRHWFDGSLHRLDKANALFLDPDNGIASPAVARTQAAAGKFAFVDEIAAYLSRAELVIVYNHRDRSPTAEYVRKFIAVRQQLGRDVRLRLMRFKRYSVRDYAFFFAPGISTCVDVLFGRTSSAPLDFLFEERPSPVSPIHGASGASM